MPTTEQARAAGRARWAGKTPEERSAGMRPAHEARVNAATVDAKIELLGTVLLDRLDALQAELAALRSDRIAA